VNSSGFLKILLLVTALAAVGQMTNTIYVPAMNMMAQHLGVLPTRIQSVMAAYLIPYGLSQFVYGPLSDRYGRKPIVILGLVIYCLGSLMACEAHSFGVLILASFVQGLGIGVAGVMARTVMRDLYSGVQLHKASSAVSVTLIFAPLVAPLFGAIIASRYGWHANFVFLSAFGVLVLLSQLFLMRETNPYIGAEHTRFSQVFGSYKRVMGNPQFLGFMMTLLVSFAGVAVFEASAGVLFTHVLKFSAEATSVLFILPLPAFIVGCYVSARIAHRISINRMMCLGIVFLSIGSILMCVTAMLGDVSAHAILLSAAVYLFGVGILFPTATAGALEPFGALAGIAGAVLGGMQNIGAGLATLLSSALPQTSQLPLGFILLSLTALVIATFVRCVGL
jgi:MFS transporter, DHA1 family, 2-module integral membrane pump EmrD